MGQILFGCAAAAVASVAFFGLGGLPLALVSLAFAVWTHGFVGDHLSVGRAICGWVALALLGVCALQVGVRSRPQRENHDYCVDVSTAMTPSAGRPSVPHVAAAADRV